MNHGLTNAIVRLMSKEVEKPREGKPGLVKMSPAMLVIGIACSALFLIPGLIVPLATGDWSMSWFFLAMVFLSSTLIIAYFNCRIWYDEDSFTVRFFLGYRKTFSYAEIESLNKSPQNEKLKVRGCTVRVGELPVGKREFLAFARKRYRIAHGGKAIPVAPKPKWDIFNGHVDNPGEFIFAYLFLLLFLPVTVLVCFFVAEPTPMEEMTFVTGPVAWTAVQEDDKTDLVLSAGGTEMEIWGYEHTLSDTEAFLRTCKAGKDFTIGYRNVTNDEGEIIGFSAEYIQDSSGEIWVTPEAARNHRFREVLLIFGILELVWLAFCGASVYVGRNPHKFSKKTIRLFFKDGYVH